MDYTTKIYNFNTSYVNKLIKESEYTDKKQISESLGITVNNLTFKLTGRSVIYINEALVICNQLRMNIYSVFCPTIEEINDFFYRNLMFPINKQDDFKPYNDYNINNEYLKNLVKEKGFKLNKICSLWNMKLVCVYDKFKGKKKISLKEGIHLSNLLEMDVNDIFCPLNDQIVNFFLNPENTDNNNEINISLDEINKYNLRFSESNKNNLQQILYQQDRIIPDMKQVLKISSTQVYNKVNGRAKFKPSEVIKLCQWLYRNIDDLFDLK